jgi:hypothetical protein
MDGRGYAVLDPVMLVEQVEDGNDAVGGAGAAGDDPMAGFQVPTVETVDNGGIYVRIGGL